ncbi:ribonuclease J [Mesoplasma lactucae]|uniref:ribonuclease J n=1 Tax=Mesoplasma lactucae TaxID=138853 RepID=UPI000CA3B5FB|nr:ribonuclease J [Mesoplasma lactucae]ATZ20310.1 ribonuclease J [Mesoplasma lactucae ATCC 49193]MCL8216481.1 Ribonuclease J2 [Mesoplasma lactucae ATCC 49193]
MADIKFMALGGQDERGKNLFIIEVDEDLFVFDCGLKYPEKGILGVDVVIPNFEYLINNASRIKGIFLSNSSAYNSGAISYLLKDIDVPVYCNDITETVLQIKLERSFLKNKSQNFKIIKDKDVVDFGKNKIEAFRLTASSPNSLGFALHTEDGIIVYAGDFIIDGQETSDFSTDYSHINKLAEEGVLALLADSEYASKMSYAVPNHKIEKYIAAPFKEKKTRIAVGIFEEDIFKLGEIVAQAKANNRKIAVYGRTMQTILKNDMIHSNLNLNDDDLISVDEYMKSDNGVLIISGNGDVLYSKLAKIATGNDDVIEFGPKDVVILATPPAPGVEKRHAQILDELARTDAKLIALSDKNIWPMRACHEDIKMLTSLLKPKYFVPIKGLYKEFLSAEKAAMDAGIKEGNVCLVDNGQVARITDKFISITDKTLPNGDTYVDGSGVGDIGNVVLNERKLLANDGVIIVGATIDSRTKESISLIDIQMRGVIYISEDQAVFKIMQKEVNQILDNSTELFKKDPKKYDLNDVKREIVSKVKSLIKQESGKQPMILCIINEIDGNFNLKSVLARSQKSRNYVHKATSNINQKRRSNKNNNQNKTNKPNDKKRTSRPATMKKPNQNNKKED